MCLFVGIHTAERLDSSRNYVTYNSLQDVKRNFCLSVRYLQYLQQTLYFLIIATSEGYGCRNWNFMDSCELWTIKVDREKMLKHVLACLEKGRVGAKCKKAFENIFSLRPELNPTEFDKLEDLDQAF